MSRMEEQEEVHMLFQINGIGTFSAIIYAMSKLFIICGISFAGKSTLGKKIAQQFGYAEVDVDDTKTQLYEPDIQD